MSPTVTVVLVCWNHAGFIEKSIRSVLDQTYKHIELIAFDNDSKDGSGDIIQSLADTHGFQFIRQENIGLIRTLSAGLERAQGKYIACLDGDDMWLPEKTEQQVSVLEANPDVHSVCGAMSAIDQNDRPLDYPLNNGSPGEVTFESLMRTGCSVQGPTVMYRAETLRKMGGFDESVRIEDYAMALHFTLAGYRVINTGEVCVLYRRHGNNWTSSPIYHDRWLIGQRFRHTAEYPAFVRHNLAGYFRWLAGDRKRDALRLLMSEPIAWTWNDVGVGLVKLLVPATLIRLLRRREAQT